MRLFISSFVGKVPQREMNLRGAEEAFDCLTRVARLKEKLGKSFDNEPIQLKEPLGAKMLKSIRSVGDPNLTPMAAVAGTIADGVADFLFSRGMTKAIVNNGGDIAVRLAAPNSVRVGLREKVESEAFTRVVSLAPSPHSEKASFGIATSGLGGRSLTCGIASAVTVIANTASMADAAATAVANASFVENPGVIRQPAETVDPQTDIPGIPITVRIRDLDRETRKLAIYQALDRAQDLVKRNIILGAMVVVDGESGMTPFFENHLVQTS
jgi:ApbE superfamily uncharacterized protein (UPF0280 family)